MLATGWVSPTVLRERSLEGKTHVDRYEQYQSFSVNYRQYCHFGFDIFALIIEIIRVNISDCKLGRIYSQVMNKVKYELSV